MNIEIAVLIYISPINPDRITRLLEMKLLVQ